MYGKTGYATKRDYDRARYIRLKMIAEAKRPPHPISQLTETGKAYIAGLIDGEGAIYAANSNHETCYPCIAIAMTHEGVLRWLAHKTGAQKIHTLRGRKNARYKSVTKPQYIYRIWGKAAQRLCKTIFPYFKVKIQQAKIVSVFPCDARIGPGKKIARSKINVIRQRLAAELRAANGNRYALRHSG